MLKNDLCVFFVHTRYIKHFKEQGTTDHHSVVLAYGVGFDQVRYDKARDGYYVFIDKHLSDLYPQPTATQYMSALQQQQVALQNSAYQNQLMNQAQAQLMNQQSQLAGIGSILGGLSPSCLNTSGTGASNVTQNVRQDPPLTVPPSLFVPQSEPKAKRDYLGMCLGVARQVKQFFIWCFCK